MGGKKKGLVNTEEFWGFIFIAPQFAGLLLFIILPVIQSLGISFTNWNMMTPATFVGLANYKKILFSPTLSKILGNTVKYILGFSVLTIVFSLLTALALSGGKVRGFIAYRTMYFLPNITSTVATSLVWLWLFNPEFGFVNIVLGQFGINPPGWYGSVEWATPKE